MATSGASDLDQTNNGKSSKSNSIHTDSSNGVAKVHKKQGKEVARKCRCPSTKSSSSRSTASTSTSSNLALLNKFKDLPVREYDKLAPHPPDILELYLATIANAEKKSKEKSFSLKETNLNGSQPTGDRSTKRTKTEEAKTDDTLILKIDGLEGGTRRLSTNSVNADGEKAKLKVKVRTKTDPHPITAAQKTREFSSSSTVLSHSSSKCNCSSCKSMSSSTSSDNHNKTKSVGTQHDANNAFDPWIRQDSVQSDAKKAACSKALLSQKLANSNAKVIIITDDFTKKALNQEVIIDTKRKMLRHLKANKMTNSSRSMDDDNEPDDGAKMDKQKAISKSVDNVSQLSIESDQLDNVGSVELIFISDEFLNKVTKPDVIILVSTCPCTEWCTLK